MQLGLLRKYGVDATTGTFSTDTKQFFSIEAGKDHPTHPCVPEGLYRLIRYLSPTHGKTWVLVNDALGVGFPPDKRTYAEIHSANWARQLEACIALGLHGQPMLDPLTGQVEPAVEDSVDAVGELHDILGYDSDDHTLLITSAA